MQIKNKTPNSRVVIHIGLQKTASTFLQHTLWPNLYPELVRHVHGKRKVRTSSNVALEILTGMRSRDQCAVPFISCEKLSGKLNPVHRGQSIDVFERFLDKISRSRIKPKVLVFLRPQSEWLESAFRYVVSQGGVRNDFESYLERFNFEDLSWNLRIQKLFSAGVPTVALPYHLLKERPRQAFMEISRFCDRDLSEDSVERILGDEKTRSNRAPRSEKALKIAALEARLRSIIKRTMGVTYSADFQEKLILLLDSKCEKTRDFKDEVPQELKCKFSQDYADAIHLAKQSESPLNI